VNVLVLLNELLEIRFSDRCVAKVIERTSKKSRIALVAWSPDTWLSSCGRHGSGKPAQWRMPPTTRPHSGNEVNGDGPSGQPCRTHSLTKVATAESSSDRWRRTQPLMSVWRYSDQKIIDETAGQLITTGFSEA